MCGAFGSGTVRAPWETAAHGSGPRALAERAAQARALLGWAWQVRPFGPAGYAACSPTGAATVDRDLDDLVATLLSSDRVRARAGEVDSFVAGVVRDRQPNDTSAVVAVPAVRPGAR